MIEIRTRKMFWAPTRKRHYATLRQACLAEAGAILTKEWYADGDGDEGRWTDSSEWVMHRNALAEDLEREARK